MKNIKILLHVLLIIILCFVVFYLSVIYGTLHENNQLEKINKQKLQSIEIWQKSISGQLQDINDELKLWR